MRHKSLPVIALLCALCLLTACGSKSENVNNANDTDGADRPAVVITADSVDKETGKIVGIIEEGGTATLDEIANLTMADLRGSECFEEIYTWSKAHPGVVVLYDVTLPTGETVENRVSSVDLSTLKSGDVKAAINCLSCLPKVTKVELGSERSGFGLTDVNELQKAFPNIRFSFAFELYGQSLTTNDTLIDISHIPVEDNGEAVVAAMSVMPKLESVDMDSCGLDNERMAEIRDMFPDVKVIWRVWFGRAYSVRTDVERILASKPSKGGMLYSGNCEALKYCTEVRFLDVGHNDDLDTIEFLRYMPKLEVAILAMAKWSDLSPIAECKNLEYLEVFTTNVSDLSPLAELTSLRHLNICNTSVSDISPLFNNSKLERLWIGGWIHIPPEQIQQMQEIAPDCDINASAGDPTEGRWRVVGYHENAYMYVLHPRYAMLRDQFDLYEDKAFSFYWNDPLYIE